MTCHEDFWFMKQVHQNVVLTWENLTLAAGGKWCHNFFPSSQKFFYGSSKGQVISDILVCKMFQKSKDLLFY